MHRWFALALCLAVARPAAAVSDAAVDARMDAYFATWSDNARLTQSEVDRVYARQVDYYGRVLSRPGVLRAKLAVARPWPQRRYRVAPGSVHRACGERSCSISLVLEWRVAGAGGRAAGASTVSLTLVREDGAYKIAAERGRTLGR